MAFGDIIRSWPAPGNAASVYTTLWLGAMVSVIDQKNAALLICDPTSLAVLRTIANGGTVQQATCVRFGTHVLGTADGNNQVRAMPWIVASNQSTAVASIAFGCLGMFWTGAALVVQGTDASFRVLMPSQVGSYWSIVRSIHPRSYTVATHQAAFRGADFITVNNASPRMLVRHHWPSMTIVKTATAPANDDIYSVSNKGASVLVSVAGATDRIYEVSVL